MNKHRYLALLITLLFISCGQSDNELSDRFKSDRDRMTETMNDTGMINKMGDMKSRMKKMMDEMHSYKITGDADYDYANMMIHHHQASIDMAQNIKLNGKDEALMNLADEMIIRQQKDIEKFNNWLSGKTAKPEGAAEQEGYKAEMDKMMKTMMENTEHQMSGDIDKDYADMMIKHHNDANMMSDIQTKYGNDVKLKSTAQRIKEDQFEETVVLERWQKNR
jgi:uncharacterized protein (DUF305 family)